MAFRLEIDEEVDATIPAPILDDDDDTVTPSSITWDTTDANVAFPVPAADNLSAVIKSNDTIGTATVTAHVFNSDGESGDYFVDLSLGTGVAVGGDLSLGTPRKRT